MTKKKQAPARVTESTGNYGVNAAYTRGYRDYTEGRHSKTEYQPEPEQEHYQRGWDAGVAEAEAASDDRE